MTDWFQFTSFFKKFSPEAVIRVILIALAVGFFAASTLTILAEVVLFRSFEVVLTEQGPPKNPKQALDHDPSTGMSTSLNRQQVENILVRNLFNQAGKDEGNKEQSAQAAAAGTSPQSMTKSDLNVTILGIIYGGDPQLGAVTLKNNTNNQVNTFLVDEFIVNDAQLVQVLDQRIVVLRGGKLEYIDMPEPELPTDPRRRTVKGPKSPGPAPKSLSERFSEPGFERGGNEIRISSDYRNKLLSSDFSKVLQDAKAEPNLVGGELNGFRLTRIRTDSIYEKSGLQNGDVIREINGVSLVDTAQTIKLLNTLRSVSEIEVRVNRGSADFVMQIQVQ